MRRSLLTRALRVGLVPAAVAAMLLAAVPAAHAVPVSIGNDTIAAFGSDTTENLMDQVLTCASGSNPSNCTTGYNVHAVQNTAFTVPTDPSSPKCNTFTYQTPAGGNILAPKGSSAGRRALRDSAASATFPVASPGGKGCADIARSSADPGTPANTDNIASAEYYAYALDAVGWGSTSLNAPSSLTVDQVRKIYNCQFNNWAEVGGSPGPIFRAFPQSGSGTQATFINKILGGVDPNTSTTGTDSGPLSNPPGTFTGTGNVDGGRCSPLLIIEENHGKWLTDPSNGGIASGFQQYIYPYSQGKWVVQANAAANPFLDLRGGLRIGSWTTITTGTATENAQSPVYGVRWGGSTFLLNNNGTARTLVNGTPGATTGTTTTNGTSTVTAPGAGLVAADEGVGVQGDNIPAGSFLHFPGAPSATTFQLVNSAGTPVNASGSSTTGRLFLTSTPISEQNPNITDINENRIFPGVRYLYNVLDSLQSSGVGSYEKARCLVGMLNGDNVAALDFSDATATSGSATITTSTTAFTDSDLCRAVKVTSDTNGAFDAGAVAYITAVNSANSITISQTAQASGPISLHKTGAKSQLCSGDADTQTIITGEGFLPLGPKTIGGNLESTCRIKTNS